MNQKYICALSAVVAVVLFLTIISFMVPGEASYTRSPETWYWTTVQNTSFIMYSGGWVYEPSTVSEETKHMYTSTGGTLLIPIYAVNPNPTLYLRARTNDAIGHLLFFGDGRVGSGQVANISLYSLSDVYNTVVIIPTNLSAGYSTLNITVWTNGSQNDASFSAMWLQ